MSSQRPVTDGLRDTLGRALDEHDCKVEFYGERITCACGEVFIAPEREGPLPSQSLDRVVGLAWVNQHKANAILLALRGWITEHMDDAERAAAEAQRVHIKSYEYETAQLAGRAKESLTEVGWTAAFRALGLEGEE